MDEGQLSLFQLLSFLIGLAKNLYTHAFITYHTSYNLETSKLKEEDTQTMLKEIATTFYQIIIWCSINQASVGYL